MGAGASSKSSKSGLSKVDRRLKALAAEHADAEAQVESIRKAEREKARNPEDLTLRKLAGGKRKTHCCPDCGHEMGCGVDVNGLKIYTCEKCRETHEEDRLREQVIQWGIRRAHGDLDYDVHPDKDEEEDPVSSRPPSKGGEAGRPPSKERPTSKDARRPSKEGRLPSKEAANGRSGSKQSRTSLHSSVGGKEEANQRSGSKQSRRSSGSTGLCTEEPSRRSTKQSTASHLSNQAARPSSNDANGKSQDLPSYMCAYDIYSNNDDSKPKVVHRRVTNLRRSSTVQAAIMAMDMQGFAIGDRVSFEEYDEVAHMFGIGTIEGPTAVKGVLSVRFDNHEHEKTFNLKADGLRKLNHSQEATIKIHGDKLARRSTIG